MSDAVRRKYPRCPYLQPICITFMSQSVIVNGEEIGEGGLSFLTDVEIPIDTQLVLNFFISNGQYYCLRGAMRNKTEVKLGQSPAAPLAGKKNKKTTLFQYGIYFNEVNITLKRQIRSFVARSSHTLKNQKTVNAN